MKRLEWKWRCTNCDATGDWISWGDVSGPLDHQCERLIECSVPYCQNTSLDPEGLLTGIADDWSTVVSNTGERRYLCQFHTRHAFDPTVGMS